MDDIVSRAVERKSKDKLDARYKNGMTWDDYAETSVVKLTPAGEALVNLFRVTGIFIQSDAGIRKKASGA